MPLSSAALIPVWLFVIPEGSLVQWQGGKGGSTQELPGFPGSALIPQAETEFPQR